MIKILFFILLIIILSVTSISKIQAIKPVCDPVIDTPSACKLAIGG